MTFPEYQRAVANLPYGKRLPSARYLYFDPDIPLPEPLGALVAEVWNRVLSVESGHNIIKFHTDSFKISLLHYPRFFDDPHPALAEALAVDLSSGKVKRISYSARDNPPILHRKETMLPAGHTKAVEFERLSVAEESAGLFEHSNAIGFKLNWERLLREKGLGYDGHSLVAVCAASPETDFSSKVAIQRHRTAINRPELSKPVRQALQLGLLREGQTFFDYGSGRGGDVAALRDAGFDASGWDPAYAPDAPKIAAAVVNLGFVLNVIEDPVERVETLIESWSLAQEVLLVSTLVEGQEGSSSGVVILNDGIVTSRGTFQKYFAQAELQLLIEETLEVEADAIGVGVFVIFRSAQVRQAFLFSRIQRMGWDSRVTHRLRTLVRPLSKRTNVDDVYRANQALIDSYWLRMIALGRSPTQTEFEGWRELNEKVGAPAKVARLAVQLFGSEALEESRAQRTADLQIYLAMAQFRQKVSFSSLPEGLQLDVKTFFGSYQAALTRARELLWSAGQPEIIAATCDGLPFGFCTEDHYTVHRSLLDELPPVLRVYVHCSSLIYGNPHDADLIKVHKHSGKVTLLFYDDFDEKLLPELRLRVKVNLRTLRAQVFDHSLPPYRQLMPFKERFLGEDDPALPDLLRFAKKLRKLGLTPEATEQGVSPTTMKALLKGLGK
jgi:DNA phosphorothioation-associated putative methyltransferase